MATDSVSILQIVNNAVTTDKLSSHLRDRLDDIEANITFIANHLGITLPN